MCAYSFNTCQNVLSWFKVVLEGYRRCPDIHDLSECHRLYDSYIEAAPGCQKSSPSYKFKSLNFHSEKLSETTLWDHLKQKMQPWKLCNLTLKWAHSPCTPVDLRLSADIWTTMLKAVSFEKITPFLDRQTDRQKQTRMKNEVQGKQYSPTFNKKSYLLKIYVSASAGLQVDCWLFYCVNQSINQYLFRSNCW